MENNRFPNRLKMFRRCSGLSQKKVARKLGLADTSTLSRWEHGLAIPGLVQVFRLSRIYKALPQELFEEYWNHIGSEYNSLLADDCRPFNNNQSLYL
jgi:transcriptional regulator with XRE-family HTH domain